MNELSAFILGFLFNLAITLVLVRCIYYPVTRNKNYVFTFIAFSTLIFFVLSFLASVEIGVGVGFGLFAIFSILRYRTDPIPIREMTYLFIIAALPVMNSAAAGGEVWPQLIIANLAIVGILYILEKGWGFKFESNRQITYEKVELVRPDREAELIADLQNRTGLKINRISVGKLDYLHDTALLKIYFSEPQSSVFQNGDMVLAAETTEEDD
jgi:hypothetical protein